MIPFWLEFSAALAEVGAGCCLAFPALRLSKHMLQLHKIQKPQCQEETELERLRNNYVSAMSRLLSTWDSLDHRLLRIGFVAFIFSATVNLIGLAASG